MTKGQRSLLIMNKESRRHTNLEGILMKASIYDLQELLLVTLFSVLKDYDSRTIRALCLNKSFEICPTLGLYIEYAIFESFYDSCNYHSFIWSSLKTLTTLIITIIIIIVLSWSNPHLVTWWGIRCRLSSIP